MKIENTTGIQHATLQRMIEFVDPGLANDVRIICKTARAGRSHGRSSSTKKKVTVYLPTEATALGYPRFIDFEHRRKWIKSHESIPAKSTIKKEQEFNGIQYKLVEYKSKTTGYLSDFFLTREEEMISILAHELRHQWQKRRPSRSLWAYGCSRNTKFSTERDASVYAERKVREWRRLVSPKQVYPAELW